MSAHKWTLMMDSATVVPKNDINGGGQAFLFQFLFFSLSMGPEGPGVWVSTGQPMRPQGFMTEWASQNLS